MVKEILRYHKEIQVTNNTTLLLDKVLPMISYTTSQG